MVHRRRAISGWTVVLVALFGGLAPAATGGCAAASRPLEIAVREVDSRRPVAGATVRIAGADLVVPGEGEVVGPATSAAGEVVTGGSVRLRSGFTAVEGRTDAFGLLILSAPTDAPFEVMIIRPGDPLRRVLLGGEEHPARRGLAGPWIDLDGPMAEGVGGVGDGPKLEMQLRPSPL